jgi:hypothetical protein
MKKKYKIKTKVWIWPSFANASAGQAGSTSWHFVNIPKDISEKIRSVYTKGFVPVVASVGESRWETSLFPHKMSGYLLCIKKNIREKECIYSGDEVTVNFEIK